jgi:pimeloyl-ACP methyl ester carboxylesterase
VRGPAGASHGCWISAAATYAPHHPSRTRRAKSSKGEAPVTRGPSRDAEGGAKSTASLTDEPVAMLGCSLGAVIGLHLAVRHPGQLHTLVAHEPVAPWLLPAAEAAHQRDELRALQDVYATGGMAAAFPEIARVLGIDPSSQDTEPDLTPAPLTDQRRANFDLFIRHDFTAVIEDDLVLGDLGDIRIIPAAGRTTPRTVFDYRCAQVLASRVDAPLAEFPGGHNGNTSHPRAYAERLREVLK